MQIPVEKIRGFNQSTRPFVVYRNPDGTFRAGFVMREGEFVVSLYMLGKVKKLAGINTSHL